MKDGTLLTALPDRRRSLSEGVLVEASVVARLFGLRLLKIKATVMLMPADVAASSAAPPRPPGREPARVSGVPRRGLGTGHRGLAEAVRNIDEGAQLLAEARRNGA